MTLGPGDRADAKNDNRYDEQQTTEHCPYSKTTGCLHEISSTFARIDRLCSRTAVRADNLSWIIVYATVVINTFTFFVPVRPLLVGAIHRAFPDASSTRVSVAIQFTSQVLLPSSENACSKRPESSNTEESIRPLDSLKSNWLRLGQRQGVLPEWSEIWKSRCAMLLPPLLLRHPLNT